MFIEKKMSEFVIDDWKLKARTVVRLHKKNTNTSVSSLAKPDIVIICLNVSLNYHEFFISSLYLHRTEVKDLQVMRTARGKTTQCVRRQKPMKLDKTD